MFRINPQHMPTLPHETQSGTTTERGASSWSESESTNSYFSQQQQQQQRQQQQQQQNRTAFSDYDDNISGLSSDNNNGVESSLSDEFQSASRSASNSASRLTPSFRLNAPQTPLHETQSGTTTGSGAPAWSESESTNPYFFQPQQHQQRRAAFNSNMSGGASANNNDVESSLTDEFQSAGRSSSNFASCLSPTFRLNAQQAPFHEIRTDAPPEREDMNVDDDVSFDTLTTFNASHQRSEPNAFYNNYPREDSNTNEVMTRNGGTALASSNLHDNDGMDPPVDSSLQPSPSTTPQQSEFGSDKRARDVTSPQSEKDDEEVARELSSPWQNDIRCGNRKIKYPYLVFAAVVALVVVAIVPSVVLTIDSSGATPPSTGNPVPNNSSTASPFETSPTLAAIRARGHLQCGVVDQRGFSAINSATGQREGFEVDLCRAVGAAIFGEDGFVTFKAVSNAQRFITLQSGDVDLVAAGVTVTMERDIYEPSTEAGFTFSAPYLYNGLSFAGIPQYVACTDALLNVSTITSVGSNNTICNDLRICVLYGTTHADFVQSNFSSLMENAGVVMAPSSRDLYLNFVKGYCNIIAGEQFDLADINVRQLGYTDNYTIGANLYSKEPLALATRDDDAVWSDFVNWVLLALLTAEDNHQDQAVAAGTLASPAFPLDDANKGFLTAVATVGNYAELYHRHLASLVSRALVNTINNGTTPLLYSFPLGDVTTNGRGPVAGGTLERIKQRGKLRCGVGDAVFFSRWNVSMQQWSGLDVDFCRAISAAIFNGDTSTIEFVNLTGSGRFVALSDATFGVDVVTRTTSVTYERDVQEPTTKSGFTFSQPGFYTGLQFGGIPPYGKCANNINVRNVCQDLRICVSNGTTTIDRVRGLFVELYIIPKPTEKLVAQCLVTGEGNAIAGDGFDTANATIRLEYTGSYQESTKLHSHDNFAIVTRQDDPQWSSFVNWIVFATFYAEEQGILQATFQRMPLINLFGDLYANMFRNAIQAVGSYHDIYQRNAGSKYPRSPVNQLNNNPIGPQLYPPPGLFDQRNL